MTPIAQSPLNRDWAEDTEAEAMKELKSPVVARGSNVRVGLSTHTGPSSKPHVEIVVQSNSPSSPPDSSPTAKIPERKARRNTTQAVSCPEPPTAFHDSPRATSQPISPAAAKLPSSTQNIRIKAAEEPKQQLQVPTGPRSPPRSPSRSRGGSRGRGFRSRFRGRGRRNPSKAAPIPQQGLGPSSSAPSQAPSSSAK